MGKFKIDSKELSDFLRNMFINNEFDTKDIIFRLKKDGLYINATSASQSLFVSGHLNEEIFHEIVPFNFILNNISEFIKLIENFDTTITVTEETGKLIIRSEKEKFSVPLINGEISEQDKVPNLSFEEYISLSGPNVLDGKKIARFRNTIKEGNIILEVIDKHLLIHIGDNKFKKYIYRLELNLEKELNCKSSFGEQLLNILQVIDKKTCKLFLKNDYPMQINYNPTNFSEVKYILAPRAD